MPKISVCIPVYEMYGVGVQMLERCLESLEQQTFKDFEVVISDNSDGVSLWKVLKLFDLRFLYLNNPIKGMAPNTNCALTHARGELVKILYQDDYLAHNNALQLIVDNFKTEWLITACSNNPRPYYSSQNTLGSPSVLTMRKDTMLLFNNLKWTLDLDLYKRLYKKYGKPTILNDINVIMGIGEWQQTSHLTDEEKLKEELINAKE